MPAAGSIVRYRFGRFELQPEERRLLEGDVPIALRPHAFDLLVALVEHAGSLVTKDELLERVWRTVVVEENTLQAHVSALRKVLGPESIATVTGRGYRFVQHVEQCSATAGAARDAVAAPPHNLPHALTRFIGRDREMAELRRLLGTTRLLTLTGFGGTGKTRLALEVARHVVPEYRGGVWLVELAALADPVLLPQTLANVLGVREQAGTLVMDSVVQHLASRHALLVLDNAEHLLDACAHMTEALLVRCARLTILVTSRERLGITGELAYAVPSLSIPDDVPNPTAESVAAHESARLFIDRARLQQPDFTLTDENAAALASICRRLDGIALALELAVPRLRVLTLEQLRDRLDHRFQLLTEGSRTALPRHRTLQSLIDWSHDMLSDAEKSLLHRVSAFLGGWTLEAAERVCVGGGLAAADLLDLLASLVEKSLVLIEEHQGAVRYRLLETIRAYAYARLQCSAEHAGVLARHLDHFVDMADQGHRHELAADATAWLDRIERERDNFRAALRWGCQCAGPVGERALRLAGLLAWFWVLRGHFAEGREWVSAALAAGEGTSDAEALARGLRALGALALMQGDVADARRAYERALEIERSRGDRRQLGIALYNVACLVTLQERYSEARALFEQAQSIHRELGDRAMTAMCVGNLAMLVTDHAAARAYLEEALSIWRDLGDWRTSFALYGLGVLAYVEGDPRAAELLLEESLALARKAGSRPTAAWTLSVLGRVAYEQGDQQRAARLLTEVLTIQRDLGDLSNLGNSLEGCAAVALTASGPLAAASLWGQAEALRERMGASPTQPYRRKATESVLFAAHPLRERLVPVARAELANDPEFDRAWRAGRAMSWQQAIDFALESMSGALTSPIPTTHASNAAGGRPC